MRLLTLMLGVLWLLVSYQLWLSEHGARRWWALNNMIRIQQAENVQLQERNQALAVEVADLKQGLAAFEERARSELGMIRHDETFFRILEEPPTPPPPVPSERKKPRN